VAARAPAAVDVPVPNPGERLRPYLKRLAEMIEEGGPAAQPLSGDDNGARHQRGSLHNLLHALFG
jgi:hypothetical protein